jgi:hypothetical protein
LTVEQRNELSALAGDRSVAAVMAGRARMLLWPDEGHSAEQAAAPARVSRPTVNTRLCRCLQAGVAGPADRPRPGKAPEVPGPVPARIPAPSRTTAPAVTGLSHRSSRRMALYLRRHEGIGVSRRFIAGLWRDNDLRP